MKPTRKGAHIQILLTDNQARALFDVVGAANLDRDHENWLRDAGAKPAEIRALRDVMQIASDALRLTKWVSRRRPEHAAPGKTLGAVFPEKCLAIPPAVRYRSNSNVKPAI